MAETQHPDTTTLRHSPLEAWATVLQNATVPGPRGVALREIPFLTMVGLRATPGATTARALSDVVDLGFPAGPGPVTGSPEDVAILWQGPDEFLLVGPDETVLPPGLTAGTPDGEREPGALPTLSTSPLAQRLADALVADGGPGQVVDLSANRTTLELTGPSARPVLEKGCPIDLHPRVFAVGSAVSTTLGLVQVLLWRTGEQTWRIMPRASFAQYTAQWLLDAMTEFASPEVA